MIYDKYEKREKGVVIPLIGPAEKMNDVKRKIYQTLVEYKVFESPKFSFSSGIKSTKLGRHT